MTISKSLATLLRDCRNNYQYPGAYVAVTEVAPFDINVGTLMARFNPGGRASNTPLSLDAYHHSLVARSGSPDLEHLGTASIIYWGFITFSDGFARGRAGRYSAKETPATIHAAIVSAARDISRMQYGLALSRFAGLSQLGQLPFASKLVAYLSPENAAVYDNRINSFVAVNGVTLCDPTFTAVPRNRKGQMARATVAAAVNQTRYQAWCDYLGRLRDDLNGLGRPFMWQGVEFEKQRWRAIDVERAIFALANQPRAGQTAAATLLNQYCRECGGQADPGNRSKLRQAPQSTNRTPPVTKKQIGTVGQGKPFNYSGNRSTGVRIELSRGNTASISGPSLTELASHFSNKGWIDAGFSRTGTPRQFANSFGHFVMDNSNRLIGRQLNPQHAARIAAVLVDLRLCQFRKRGRSLQFNFDLNAA